MSELIDGLDQTLANPQQMHAMLVHFPVAIGVIGLITLIALAITRGRSNGLRWLAAGLYFAGGVTAYLAMRYGFQAAQMVEVLTPAYMVDYNRHQELAENLWYALIGQSVVIGLTAIRRKAVRITLLAASIGLAVWLSGWIALTAHQGGKLVYVHGAASPTAVKQR